MELFGATLSVAILRLNSILDRTRHGIINAQNGTLNQLDLSGFRTAKTTAHLRLLLSLDPAVFGIEGRVGTRERGSGIKVTKLTKAASITISSRSLARHG